MPVAPLLVSISQKKPMQSFFTPGRHAGSNASGECVKLFKQKGNYHSRWIWRFVWLPQSCEPLEARVGIAIYGAVLCIYAIVLPIFEGNCFIGNAFHGSFRLASSSAAFSMSRKLIFCGFPI